LLVTIFFLQKIWNLSTFEKIRAQELKTQRRLGHLFLPVQPKLVCVAVASIAPSSALELMIKSLMAIPRLMAKEYRHHAGCAALAMKKKKKWQASFCWLILYKSK
jgi:hypothetical protein